MITEYIFWFLFLDVQTNDHICFFVGIVNRKYLQMNVKKEKDKVGKTAITICINPFIWLEFGHNSQIF